MTSTLHVLHDPPLDGPTNMARDEHLLYADKAWPAILRLYAWNPPTISLGYFQRYERLADLPDEIRNLSVVRRITGGGAIFMEPGLLGWELAFSRKTLGVSSLPELTREICEAAAEGISRLGVAARPGKPVSSPADSSRVIRQHQRP